MAELVVVSAIVLTTVVAFYTSYNKIYSSYKTRLNYYDVTTLYRLGYYRDVLRENNVLDSTINDASVNYVTKVYDSKTTSGNIIALGLDDEVDDDVSDIVFLINNKREKIKIEEIGVSLRQTFYDYIEFFNNTVDYTKFPYMMIMERCRVLDDGSIDEDVCYYAYLEIIETETT